jgi:hypothetical protein
LRADGIEDTGLGYLKELAHPVPLDQVPKHVVDAFVEVHGDAWRDGYVKRNGMTDADQV